MNQFNYVSTPGPAFYEQKPESESAPRGHPNQFNAVESAHSYEYSQRYAHNTADPSVGLPFIPAPQMSNFAVEYGSTVMGHGTDFVTKTVKNYVSTSNMKYYFAVNNSYVARKLALVLFPFAQTKWSVQFDPSGPVPPGDDINAPDLYIPLMAFITYVLISGAILGFQNSFSPEQLGVIASESFGWLVIEVLVFLCCVYVINQQSNISYLDLIGLCGYKFVSMISNLIGYILLDKPGYYFALLYTSVALAYLLIRTLKVKVQPNADSYAGNSVKPWAYLLLVIALVQPALMWWLTRRVVFTFARSV